MDLTRSRAEHNFLGEKNVEGKEVKVGLLVRGAWDGLGHRTRLCFVGSDIKRNGHGLSGETGGSDMVE